MDMTNIRILRSARRTLAVEIRPDSTVLVRAPMRMPMRDIETFLHEKEPWIREHLARTWQNRAAGEAEPLGAAEIRGLASLAAETFPPKVRTYAARMGVSFGRITVRNQTTRWGSCSSAGNLNFNCLLMLAPEPVRDYVIVHELAHRKHMDHSSAFWAEVASVLPDYRERRKWLKDHGGELMQRMESGQSAETSAL